MVVGKVNNVKAESRQILRQLGRRIKERVAGREPACGDRRLLIDKGKVGIRNLLRHRAVDRQKVIAAIRRTRLRLPVDDVVDEVVPRRQQDGPGQRQFGRFWLRLRTRLNLLLNNRLGHRLRLGLGGARGAGAEQAGGQHQYR